MEIWLVNAYRETIEKVETRQSDKCTNLCVVIHNGDRLGGGVGVDGLDRSKARPAAVGRMLFTLKLSQTLIVGSRQRTERGEK